MQGQLRHASLTVTFTSECAHCARPLRITIGSDLACQVEAGLVRNVVATPAIEISAREIRARCLAGKSIRYLVPDAVAAYIAREHLYR